MRRRTHKYRRRRKTRGGHALTRIARPAGSVITAATRVAPRFATTRRNVLKKPVAQFAQHIKLPNVNVQPIVKNTGQFFENVATKIPTSFSKNPYFRNFAMMPGEEEEIQQEFERNTIKA